MNHRKDVDYEVLRPVTMTRTFKVYWSPEGRVIATVSAKDERAAIRKALYPYRRYLGEMYAEEVK